MTPVDSDAVHFAVYIDTSGSMNQSVRITSENQAAPSGLAKLVGSSGEKLKRWKVAENIWGTIHESLINKPATVRTINSKGHSKELLPLKHHTLSSLSSMDIPRPDGGTYLWEFLVKQGRKLLQTTDRWMFILISDGVDYGSPEPYNGVEGFRQTVIDLKEMGIDAEFHIIGLGLPDSACEVFRQVSGASGGMFYNFGSNEDDEPSYEDVVNNIEIAIEEAIDPALRARSRRRRQLQYLEGRSDGDLEISILPNIVAAVEKDPDMVYERMGITDLNPVEMTEWQSSFFSVAGHTHARTEQNDTWSNTISHSLDHRDESSLKITWTLDANDLQHIARGNVDKLFELKDEIRKSHIPPEHRSVIVRGLAVHEDTLRMLEDTGAELVILPADLPPPPLNPDDTPLLIHSGEVYPAVGSWAMIPTGIGSPTRSGIYVDLHHSIDVERYRNALRLDDLSFLNEFGDVPSDWRRYFTEQGWTGLAGSNQDVVASVVAQYAGLIKFLAISPLEHCKVMVLRPSEQMLEVFQANPTMQQEFMNRTEDFLGLLVRKQASNVLKFHYWPAIIG